MNSPVVVQRLLKCIDGNVDRYISHRQQGQYDRAVQRLQRAARLILKLRQIEVQEQVRVSPDDDLKLLRTSLHIERLGIPTDYGHTSGSPSSLRNVSA